MLIQYPPHRRSAIAAALTLGLCLDAQAVTVDPIPSVPGVIVSASRYVQPVESVLAAVSIISRADIERSQAPDLISLLAQQAGIDISRTGGPGQVSTLFLRGANSNQTLFLIDGVRVAATGQGLYDLAHLPLTQIERIELVRGPRAALWGSDAIGGVIHIITRSDPAADASIGIGRYGHGEASAHIGTAGDRGEFALSAAYVHDDGFNATSPDAFGFDPDDDGRTSRSANLRARYAIGSQQLTLTALGTNADVAFDQGDSQVRSFSGAVSLDGDLFAGWSQRLSVGLANEDLDTPAFASTFESRRQTVDWVLSRSSANAGILSLGGSYEHEEGRSTDFGAPAFAQTRNNRAAFASWRGAWRAQTFEVAGRYDDNSQFGQEFTANVAWGWQLAPGLRSRLSWGQGFRAPSFNELYSPGFAGLFAGNPDLAPERSRSWEAGLDWRQDRQQVTFSLYRTRVTNLIAFEGERFTALNVGRARLDGAELDWRWQLGAWQLHNTLGWQRAENGSTGSDLLRRAPRKADVHLDWNGGATWALGLDVQARAARRDFDRVLAGYTRVDLRAHYRFAPHWQIEGRLENALNRDYVLASGFNTPGRGLYVRLSWQGAAMP